MTQVDPSDVLAGLMWITLERLEAPAEDQVNIIRLFDPWDKQKPGKAVEALKSGSVRVGPVPTEEARGFAHALFDPLRISWQLAPFLRSELFERKAATVPPARTRFVEAIRARRRESGKEPSEDRVARLLVDYSELGRDCRPYEQVIEIASSKPSAIERLLTLALTELPDGGSFLEMAVSFLNEEAFSHIASECIAALRRNRDNQLAPSLIEQLAQQSPASLHPYLTDIFELTSESGYRWVNWAWRGSGTSHLDYLRGVIVATEKGNPRAEKAWTCMLETRDPTVLREALDLSRRRGPFRPFGDLTTQLQDVGIAEADDQFRRLYSDTAYHLVFSSSYVGLEPRWELKQRHPTWSLSPDGPALPFGGTTSGNCGCCGATLHHLLTMDPVPDGLGVNGCSRLVLATCLSCVGWQGPLFYNHDAAGEPHPIATTESGEPEIPAKPLRRTEAQLVATPRRWWWQDHLHGYNANLHRVGGYPSWVQSSEYPSCPECKQAMQFLLQIDSYLPTADGEAWLWGDAGLGYGFWCDRCHVSGYTFQCS